MLRPTVSIYDRSRLLQCQIIYRVLVDFHSFTSFHRLAMEFGLRLVKKTRFDDFFREHSDKKEYKTLLNRMQALEVTN